MVLATGIVLGGLFPLDDGIVLDGGIGARWGIGAGDGYGADVMWCGV